MKNNVLMNVDNYNNILDDSIQQIYNKYIGLLNEYLIHHLDTMQNKKMEKISVKKMHSYLITGIQCVSHVFKILLLYTKNTNLTIYHSQRAFYFYVEFMEQMMEDTHTFLQLTPKDACLFVYKKTIYEINSDYRTNYNMDETQNEKIITIICDIYYKLVVNLIGNTNEPLNIIKVLNNDMFKTVQELNKVQYKIVNIKVLEEKMESLNNYIINKEVINYKELQKIIKLMKK
jgi:hypothetical protein